MSVRALTLVGMADIEIMEVRAYEARCLDCDETGPIESSAFWRWPGKRRTSASPCASIQKRRISRSRPKAG